MSTRDTSSSEDPIIESRDQLVAPMAGGEKPKDAWRIGTEHEKLVYCRKTFKAPSYDEPGGIRDILLSLREFGWEPVEEGGKVVALSVHAGVWTSAALAAPPRSVPRLRRQLDALR